jgi:pre-mRNA cleavage complex 2 protein Pcf11
LCSRVYDFQPTAHLPNRCSQCAARFPAGPAGKDRLQAHLDWHFRRNRKEKENEGRGANRRWLPRAEFWIKDVTSNVISADGASSSGPSTSNKPGLGMAPKVDAAFVARQRAELQNSWIPVPSDPARAALPCPICKEKFVSEYNEDEEEWIWKNAIEADGQVRFVPCAYLDMRCVDDRSELDVSDRFQISHATCRSDAVATAVANRVIANADGKNLGLRANSPARSRGNTPQPGSNNLAVKNSPRSIRGGTPAGNPSPAIPTKLATDETDVKPSAAILQAADRLTTAVSQLREGSTDSTTSAGVKRKADEDVDSHKEAKREKA